MYAPVADFLQTGPCPASGKLARVYEVLFTVKVAGRVSPFGARSKPVPHALMARFLNDSPATEIETELLGVLPTITTCPFAVLKLAVLASAKVPFVQVGKVCT